jgi:hypothetical protein
MSAESFFTAAYKENSGNQTPSPEKSKQLRQLLPSLFSSLQLNSVLDCGCGTIGLHTTFQDTGVTYLGTDIVKPLLAHLQTTQSTQNCKFQYMDVFQDPPETADIWIARDLLNVYPDFQHPLFFQKFLESGSLYLALTSIDMTTENSGGVLGIQRKLNLQAPPYSMPDPLVTLLDGQQWFCTKKLFVYSRSQIESWLPTLAILPISSELIPQALDDIQDRNAHLTTNVRLRDVKLGDRTGLGGPKPL